MGGKAKRVGQISKLQQVFLNHKLLLQAIVKALDVFVELIYYYEGELRSYVCDYIQV